MSFLNKRNILVTLLVLFFAYSFTVYTDGTKENSMSVAPGISEGKLVWQKYNCASCHQLYGLGGFMGPDLTNILSATGKGEVYAKAFIMNGTARMPKFNLTEKELESLLKFLECVDKSGRSPDYMLVPTYWGDITVSNR